MSDAVRALAAAGVHEAPVYWKQTGSPAAGIEFPWRKLFETFVVTAIMEHFGAAAINSPLWYALARNIGRLTEKPFPEDTRTLLLRDARAIWISRGVTPQQWTMFESIARALLAIDKKPLSR